MINELTPAGKANRERFVREFVELTSIDAESLQEREIANVITGKLEDLGCRVEEDDATKNDGGSCGNLFVRIPGKGDLSGLDPILLSAHMDTVVPGKGKQAILHDDGRITGNEEAVLGADDVTGIVEILEGIRILQENDFPHRPVEILFTVSEENFGGGVMDFDFSKIWSRDAYIFDLTGPIGTAAVQAPTLIWFEIVVTGRSAHAGFDPQNGIHAIQTAAKAIARIPQGKIDSETTFNFGTIKGGAASNIVPDRCRITGEVRSYDHQRAESVLREMEEVFREEAAKTGASVATRTRLCIQAYQIPEHAPVCQRFLKAIARIDQALEEKAANAAADPGANAGTDPDSNAGAVFVSTFGGSDNNVLSHHGLQGIVLASGMYEPHSRKEYTYVQDLERGAELAAALCMVGE